MDIINTDYKEALFAVIRSGLYNESLSLSENIDLEKLLNFAAHQNLFPFVFQSLTLIKGFENTPVYKKYFPQFLASFSVQVRRTEGFLKLYPEFSNKGIYPVVVKGIICRQLYGELAECRPSGDEDIYVKKSDFSEAAKILEENGFIAERSDITEKQLETLHHLEFERKDLMIELHSNLMDYRSELRKKMNGYFASAEENGIFIKLRGIKIKTLNHTDHFLYLIFHAFSHFILSGMGIRQMIDILLYYEKYKAEIDMKYIERALRDTNSNSFLSDLIRIGNKYLGLSIEPLTEEKNAEELLDDLLCMGVFGNSTDAHIAAGQMTSAAFSGGSTLLKTIFPTRDWLSRKYPELIEKPYLLPVCWVKRLVFFLKFGNEKERISESMTVGKRRIALLKKYDILQ
ncbi:MAG: nucleotidyltransferase family protein [Clostridiales bacterium]|nr:nucleotidyltransferase family protein [Clostridiales bacterium]